MHVDQATPWADVALRRARGRADPDAPARPVALPAAWPEDGAADALASLAPGGGPASLPRLAERWIGRVVAGGRGCGLLTAGEAATLARSLRGLVLDRRAAPGAATWAGGAGGGRFVLNLPAFSAGGGFDADSYAQAVRCGVLALEALGEGRERRLSLGFADLAGLLAGLGLDYDSAAARDVAAAVAALTRGAAEAAGGACADRLGGRLPASRNPPEPPAGTVVPGLAEAAGAALAAAGASSRRHDAIFALSAADAAEALLGAESAGLAPAAGPTRTGEDGAERPTAAARRAGASAATLLAPRGPGSRAAMLAAVAPFPHAPAPLPVAAVPPRPAPRAAADGRVALGRVWKVAVGGHRVALRATEGPDGALAEVSLTLSKDSAAFRGVLEAFCHSVSLGLAHGVPLSAHVAEHAYTRFGPAGAVEGDPAIRRATSILDWAFRRLALEHLAGPMLPDPSEEECGADGLGTASQQQPLLPLDGGEGSPAVRRRGLRLVG